MESQPITFRAASRAVTAFYPITSNEPSNNATAPKRRKRSRETSKQVSLEMIRNLSGDVDSPHQLACEGNLESLKAFIETFGTTIKERDNNKATLLHHAASNNHINIMQYLIDSGIELDAVDKDGHTALHVAVLQGHIEAMHLLLNSGASDTVLNDAMDAPLHIAVRSNNTEMIAAFLEHPTIDLVVTGQRKRTPLHIIAELDNIEACEVFHNSILVKEHFKKNAGFRLCASDEDDLTPIHLAARKGSYRVLDLFMTCCISHGYPTEVVLGFIDEENSTPLHAAIDGGHIKVVEILLKHGADPTVIKESQMPPILLACSQGKLEMVEVMIDHCSNAAMCCRDQYGQTALHRCVQAINNCKIICKLVEKGADVNSVDNKGQTPLVMAIVAGSKIAVKVLLAKGADPLAKDMYGRNALHHVVLKNRKTILSLLLELPCASQLVFDCDSKGDGAIHLALKQGLNSFLSPMIALIRNQLKNIKNHVGDNYLHLAAGSGDWKALSILLEIPECHKLLNETNKYGGTPLHLAAGEGHQRAVEILLSHGAMVHRCHSGNTPFMYACLKGHPECARILFEAHPFQLAWTDDQGSTALHLSINSGNPQLVSLLLNINVPITHNFAQESFFDLIIQKNQVKCAVAVIENDRWQECLDLVSPYHPHPMLNLITHMPEIAKLVLDRSHLKADLDQNHPDYYEKFDFKYLRLKNDHSVDSSPNPDSTDWSEEEDTPMIDDEQTIHSPAIKYKGSVSRNPGSFPLNQNKREQPLEVLLKMVRLHRIPLLTHSITEAYLKSKWRSYGRWIQLTITLLVFLQVLFLLLFTILIPRPIDVQIASNVAEGSASSDLVDCENSNATELCSNDLGFGYGANVYRFITLGFALFNFAIWLVRVWKLGFEALNFVKNFGIVIDFLSFIFTLAYLIPTESLNNALWEAGALSAFFSWFSLVLKIQLFDLFGVYITMFLAITRTMIKVLVFCFFFVIAFALSFYILAGNLDVFSTIGYSLFINFAHLLGEIDYVQFVREQENLQFPTLTFFFVVALGLLLGIVINNLLIGLAVGDIEKIQFNAIVEKRTIEVYLFFQLDQMIPGKLLQRLNKPFEKKYPNKHVSFVRSIWRYFWRSVKGHDPSSNDKDLAQASLTVDRNTQELACLKLKIEELSVSQEKILNIMSQIQSMQESMSKRFPENINEEN